MQPDELLYGALGTPLFVAPEVLTGNGYDCACDMWSLGVVLYLVLCGYPPFPYEDEKGLVKAIVNGQFSFPEEEWKHVSADAKDALRRMLEIDPKQRMTPKDALQHPWFKISQSTGVLNNRGLVKFNAKRKLRASVFAVGTIFEFVRSIGSRSGGKPMKGEKESDSQQRLIEEVERTRKFIREMNVREKARISADQILLIQNTPDPPDTPYTGTGKKDLSRIELARKSLVFARDVNRRPQQDGNGSATGHEEEEEMKNRLWISQLMSSKAKKLIEEVIDGDEEHRKGANPFMEIRERGGNRFAEAPAPQTQPPRGFKKPLPTLDFGGLSIT